MKKIFISYLYIAEVYAVTKVIIAELRKIVGNYPILQMVLKELEPAGETLEKSISFSGKSQYTDLLRNLDERRDELLKALRKLALMWEQVGDEAQAAASKLILSLYDKYGHDIHDENYPLETAILKEFLAELGQDKFQNSINLIHAAQIVQNLQAAAQEFESTFNEKAEEESKNAITNDVQIAKAKAYTHTTFILSAYDYLLANNPSQEVIDSAKRINDTIENIMSTARGRKTRYYNSKPSDDSFSEE